MIDIRVMTGAAMEAALDDVARLRIGVFRAFPYLYDGDLEYERRYLQAYRDSPRAVIVGAYDGDKLVGASTGSPLSDHAADFAVPFAQTDLDLDQIFYCAESVLLPEYRGTGLGNRFFDLREDHARALGYRYSAFCGVMRPDDHPDRAADYRPLDAFWRKRGYAPLDGVVARFSWRELGDTEDTEKQLQFWLRAL